ncbi:heterokaryon incompatibility protein-domain-containing protein, partial [Clohesyomyces aquaticus]
MDSKAAKQEVIPSPYGRLDPNKDEIRLVDICPGSFSDPIELDIHVVDLSDLPKYSALSYAWNPKQPETGYHVSLGRASFKTTPNFCLHIGKNLDSAIRHLRHPARVERMWIDAICIDQNNVSERNRQVQLMGKIYSSAQDVVIWLGPSERDSDVIMNCIATKKVEESQIWWFQRVWVAQELTLARNDPLMRCGHKSVSWL